MINNVNINGCSGNANLKYPNINRQVHTVIKNSNRLLSLS